MNVVTRISDKAGSLGSIVSAMGCGACFPALASLGAALGLGFLSQFEALFVTVLLPLFAGLALLANALGWFSHRQWHRTVLGMIGPVIVLIAGVLSRMPSYFARRSSSTRACCCASSRLRSIAGVLAAMPASKGLSRRMWATCAARIIIFDGTQPTLTQVPPIVPRSMRVTRAPRSAAFSAAAIAAPPLPMTAMCIASPPPSAFWPPPSQLRALSSRPLRGCWDAESGTRAR